ncbi:MAG: hypothetical protein AAGA30_04155 [Planctomycetota bacterium]
MIFKSKSLGNATAYFSIKRSVIEAAAQKGYRGNPLHLVRSTGSSKQEGAIAAIVAEVSFDFLPEHRSLIELMARSAVLNCRQEGGTRG